MHTHPRSDANKQARGVKPEPPEEIRPDEDHDPDDREFTLDDLRDSISRVEALAFAANSLVDEIPFIPDPDRNRRVGRIFRVVEETAAAASRALDDAEAMIARRYAARGSDDPR
jgi:hypothetical protein